MFISIVLSLKSSSTLKTNLAVSGFIKDEERNCPEMPQELSLFFFALTSDVKDSSSFPNLCDDQYAYLFAIFYVASPQLEIEGIVMRSLVSTSA